MSRQVGQIDCEDGPIKKVRVICFDAVGTLIEPCQPVAESYRAAGAMHGIHLAAPEIADRFHHAFMAAELRDRSRGWIANEAGEMARWRQIVGEVFREAANPGPLFDQLYRFFADPDAWQLCSDVHELMPELRRKRLPFGVASNFDRRIHPILDSQPDLKAMAFRVVSSDVGWRKPAGPFFDAVVRASRASAGEVLHIGDSLDNDYEGAVHAGLQSILVSSKMHAGVRRITRLRELLSLL